MKGLWRELPAKGVGGNQEVFCPASEKPKALQKGGKAGAAKWRKGGKWYVLRLELKGGIADGGGGGYGGVDAS